ncbi:LRR domain containing protein [Trema orientale]|uniref:LRR domain containing protein n=1 Tax=Trema orientale TaxID=63057 RepID=A0A2P5EZA0_TREOI|nr:LRR domain containing protein [Trema orientale]
MLDGVIPVELCTLSGLRGLNLSHNQLSGNIPNKIGELSLLESLDLSDNKLVGSIPPSMSNKPSLSHLDLSHNNLSGKIPEGSQLQTLHDPSIYADNLQLCGDPLPEKCPRDDEQVRPPMSTGNEDEDDEENKLEKICFYFVIFSGYATGLWAVIGTLLFKRDWRLAYFRFADEAKERILVMVVVKLERLKRMMERPARTE